MNKVIEQNDSTMENKRETIPVIDCDVHPNFVRKRDLFPYMSDYWRDYMMAARFRSHIPFVQMTVPVNGGVRADSTPPEGGPAGSSPSYFKEQVMDEFNYANAILFTDGTFMLNAAPQKEMATALASAYNDWLIDKWLSKDPKFRGSVVVAAQDPIAAAREIDRVGGHPQMVQVGLSIHAPNGGWGKSEYGVIFEAAVRNNLVCSFHVSASGTGLFPTGPIGQPSYFVEFQSTHSVTYQYQMANMIFSGLFEKFPTLRIAFIEGGFAWVPSQLFALDTQWRALRHEVPWVKRLPSEYVRDHIWFGTQPMADPTGPKGEKLLLEIMDFIGTDRLLFASDYPHWEFDSPTAVVSRFPKEVREQILYKNAVELFNLPDPMKTN